MSCSPDWAYSMVDRPTSMTPTPTLISNIAYETADEKKGGEGDPLPAPPSGACKRGNASRRVDRVGSQIEPPRPLWLVHDRLDDDPARAARRDPADRPPWLARRRPERAGHQHRLGVGDVRRIVLRDARCAARRARVRRPPCARCRGSSAPPTSYAAGPGRDGEYRVRLVGVDQAVRLRPLPTAGRAPSRTSCIVTTLGHAPAPPPAPTPPALQVQDRPARRVLHFHVRRQTLTVQAVQNDRGGLHGRCSFQEADGELGRDVQTGGRKSPGIRPGPGFASARVRTQ